MARRRRYSTMPQPDSDAQSVGDVSQQYASLDALLAAAIGPETGDMGRQSRQAKETWCLTRNFDHAVELARYGWPEGRAKIEKLTASIVEATPTEEQFITFHDTSGSFVDVDRYIVGEPECMIEFQADARVKRTVRVGFQCVYSAGESAESIMMRGAAIGAMISALESRNVRVELVAVAMSGASYGMGEGVSTIETVIKQAEQPLDLDRLAFCLAHPSFLRRILFGAMETYPEPVRQHYGFYAASSYGSVRREAASGYEVFVTNHPGIGTLWNRAAALKLVNDALTTCEVAHV